MHVRKRSFGEAGAVRTFIAEHNPRFVVGVFDGQDGHGEKSDELRANRDG